MYIEDYIQSKACKACLESRANVGPSQWNSDKALDNILQGCDLCLRIAVAEIIERCSQIADDEPAFVYDLDYSQGEPIDVTCGCPERISDKILSLMPNLDYIKGDE